MSQTIIPQGYRIHVTTWENDGDNYKTKTIKGVTKEQIPFILAACELLRSGSNNGGATFGNLYEESTDDLIEALSELVEQYPNRPEHCDSGSAVFENLLWDLGFTDSEYFTTRVFERVKIEYVPSKIVLEDVTNQFV